MMSKLVFAYLAALLAPMPIIGTTARFPASLQEPQFLKMTEDGIVNGRSTLSHLTALREEMNRTGVNVYIVPSEDEHLSEYVAPRYKRRQWISGFTGSQGTAVITESQAALWTDGRYFEQAENELDNNWILMKQGLPDTPSIEEWIAMNTEAFATISANPFVFSISNVPKFLSDLHFRSARWQYFENYFTDVEMRFVQSIPDLVDVVWTDRPASLGSQIIVHSEDYAGENWTSKISRAREQMTKEGADYLLLTLLDEIAWTFNLRGNDIPYTPVFTSYAIIGQYDIKLFLNTSQAQTTEIKNHLQPPDCEKTWMCAEMLTYETARDALLELNESCNVWMSSSGTTFGMYSAVEEARQIQSESPIKIPKSVKNEVERNAIKRAHVYDAIALIEYIMWLEENVPTNLVTEQNGAEKLEHFRTNQMRNKGSSFEAISASGPNAALPHYGTSTGSNRNLTSNEIYLIDSGGQYFEGTTDVTRTLHFGEPTEFQKEAFTRVLLGVIDVESVIYPSSLDGNDIGILARMPLYQVGLDYRHGTGHGVGQYLTIHEYPPGVGTAGAEGYPFQVGMFTSIEPGYYEEEEFGIRHENIAMVVPANTEYHFGDFDYLTFEVVTLVPFQKKMIDITLLSEFQLNYLNDYHAKILDIVGAEAKLQNKISLYEWLEQVTAPILRNAASTTHKMHAILLSVFLTIYNIASGQ